MDKLNKKKGDNWLAILRESAPFLGLGIQLAASVLLFFFIGYWIDEHYNISPVGKLVGMVIGCTAGFIQFFKSVLTNKSNNKNHLGRNNSES